MIAHPTPGWLHAMITDRSRPDRVALDADYARNCRRALMYAAREIPRSDAEPAEHRSVLEIRRALREPTLGAMAREGWHVEIVRNRSSWTDCWTSLEMAPGIRILGQPDACGAHPEVSGGRIIPIMSSSGPAPDDIHEISNAAAIHTLNPYLERDSAAGQEIQEDSATAVVANLDSQTGRLHLSEMTPGLVKQMLEITLRRVTELAGHLGEHPGELPPRDQEQSSADCRACPWRTACWQEG